MDWLDLLAVQGTLKTLLQHHSSKASILWCLAFFTVQLSHPYMTTGKTIVLTRWTFVGKVMSLLFNILSRLVIAFLPTSLNFVATVTVCSYFGVQENKTFHSFHFIPIYLPWPVNPKGNQSWVFIGRTAAEAETPILWPLDAKNWLIGKDPDAGKDWRQEKRTTEHEMVGWHHRLDGHGFEQALGVADGQGTLAWCSSWGRKELDMTEGLN